LKLLLDQNLSPRIVTDLGNDYPDSAHVREFSMQSSADAEIWEFAKQRGCAVVSKDSDFHQRSFLYGQPPKVIWVRLGNCTTEQVLQAIRDNQKTIAAFSEDEESSFLILP